MDTYKDYQRFKEDNLEILKMIKNNGENTYLLIEDVIVVLDYIAKEAEKNTKLEPELYEIFDYGYAFLANILDEITYISHDYLDNDVLMFRKYDRLVTYWFYIQDLQGFIESEIEDHNVEHLKSSINELDHLLDEIDEIFRNRKDTSEELFNHFEEIISKCNPDLKHKDSFTIFSLIREDLVL